MADSNNIVIDGQADDFMITEGLGSDEIPGTAPTTGPGGRDSRLCSQSKIIIYNSIQTS